MWAHHVLTPGPLGSIPGLPPAAIRHPRRRNISARELLRLGGERVKRLFLVEHSARQISMRTCEHATNTGEHCSEVFMRTNTNTPLRRVFGCSHLFALPVVGCCHVACLSLVSDYMQPGEASGLGSD